MTTASVDSSYGGYNSSETIRKKGKGKKEKKSHRKLTAYAGETLPGKVGVDHIYSVSQCSAFGNTSGDFSG